MEIEQYRMRTGTVFRAPFHPPRFLPTPKYRFRRFSSVMATPTDSTPSPSPSPSDPTTPLSRICVFCGSSSGSKPEYRAAAVALGQRMVEERIGLVYGGGTVGLMGAIATTVSRGDS